ncbi:alpha/beta hydrolase-fold protein [Candidatus Neomarinimicrobiota bacterium]
MKNRLIIIFLILMAVGCKTSDVTFIAQVPDTTEHVTITGNLSQLGNWDPTKLPLYKINDNEFSITIKLPKNTNIEYKITRGSWNTEALTQDGRIPKNHTMIIAQDTTIIHIVSKWRDKNTSESKITGSVEYHHDFYSSQLNNYRDIIVWLPSNYSVNMEKRYPVLYLHDGQNVFDPGTSYLGIDWQLDETVTKLIEGGKIKEILMVAINCTDDRITEYSPMQNGEKYSQFLIESVKPMIDSTYRTLTDSRNTAVMGSSMGGIISFHLAWEYHDIFSMAGCLSPSFLVDNKEVVKRIKKTKYQKQPVKLVILNGSVGLDVELQPAITELVNVLKSVGYNDLIYKIFEGAEHNEAAWAMQVEIPLLYFFGIK